MGGKVHPLTELTAAEIVLVANQVKGYAVEQGLSALRFNVITLQEPPKALLIEYEASPECTVPRKAFVIVQAPPKAPVVEAVIVLEGGAASVESWTEVEGVQPMATPDDCFEAEAIVKADPGIQTLLKERYGITNMDEIACDPWSINAQGPDLVGRLLQTFLYKRSSEDDNHYAHPIDMLPIVDLTLKKVVHCDKPYEVAPKIPPADVNYHRSLMGDNWRTDLAKPLDISQPEGPSFEVDGNLISWQNWQIRVSFNYREGLVLHNVGYKDGGKIRPIMHRGSLVEMAVPYGDPREPFQRKCAFDVGDYGLGYCANSLALGCDCLGHIHYFDAVMANSKGEPYTVEKAVCLHEEDSGLLWKHMEYRNGHSEVRRSRRLVISFIATVVNYEYLFYWYFYQDGTIQFEIKLSGELSTNMLSPDEAVSGAPTHGILVSPGVNSQVHQHLFCARLDMAIDDTNGGKGLVVSEVNIEAMPDSPENPYGNGFWAVETDLDTESVAQRSINPATARVWKIKNPASIHPVTGGPVAYKLMAVASPTLLPQPKSVVFKRGLFATKHLWVTPYTETEKFPAGDYVMQSSGGAGIEEWIKQDRRVSGADPVVWHHFGLSHFPRVEDFPVMPVEMTGFTMKPANFFGGNPGVDIPPSVNTASKLCCSGCA